MKSIFTYTFLFLFAIKAFSFEREYNINLKIKGMENQIGILAYYYGDKRYVKDTLLFNEKGISIYKGNKEIPRGVYLLAFPSLNYRSFDLILNETNFSIQTDTVNFIKNAHIKFDTPLTVKKTDYVRDALSIINKRAHKCVILINEKHNPI